MNNDSVKKTVDNLKKNGFEVEVFENGEQAKESALKEIPEGSVIGFGGSMTVSQIGLLDALRKGNYKLYDQYKLNLSSKDKLEIRRLGLTADYYITGTNAITESGELINVDSIGNRVAAQIFGPRKVFIFVSTSKIVTDIEAGLERIRTVAAPLNAHRFALDLPCIHGKPCSECPPETTLCNVTTIIHRQRLPRIKIFLIKETLGY